MRLPASKKVVSPATKPVTAPNTSVSVRTSGKLPNAASTVTAASATNRPNEPNSPRTKSETPVTTSRAQRNGVAK